MAGEPLITVVGNLVADPEPRVSQAGKPWVTFRIASTPRVHDKQSNEWKDGEPLWLGCRAYGEYAENLAASLTKGMRVILQGRLTQRSYTDNQGQQRTSLDLEVEECGPSLRFATAQVQRGGVGGGGGGGSAASHYGAPQTSAQQQYGQPSGGAQSQLGWGQPAVPPQQQQQGGWPEQPPARSASGWMADPNEQDSPWGKQMDA